jgi:hypothetical protein
MTPIEELVHWMQICPRTFAETKKMIHYLSKQQEEERMTWISVTDRTKVMQKDTDYLLLFETGEIRRYYEDYLRNAVITHWMPLPKKIKK